MYPKYEGIWKMFPYFSCMPSRSRVSFPTLLSAPPDASKNFSRRTFMSFTPFSSFCISLILASSGSPSSCRNPSAPPPLASAENSSPIADATPASSIAARLPVGMKPMASRSAGTFSKSFDTKCAMKDRMAVLSSLDTGVTSPQSRMQSFPSDVRNKLPGCGSACSRPMSSNMARYAARATAHNRGTSPASLVSRRCPSIHPVVNTRRVDAFLKTGAAVTTPAKSGLESIAKRNRSPLFASRQ
mmetsp:Transcript_9236/g.30725  ORF Transcript_9236/g.30725 Transcript_9236/m.30725 type:complete len:243 (-) Transcript_9236:1031-1759(-)